jgi:RNA polymerase sigma-70 factor (ECF subfamily)
MLVAYSPRFGTRLVSCAPLGAITRCVKVDTIPVTRSGQATLPACQERAVSSNGGSAPPTRSAVAFDFRSQPYVCGVLLAPLQGVEQKPDAHAVTALLDRVNAGQEQALEELLAVVYRDLKRQAAAYLRRENAGHTLQPTALVHEAYMRLVEQRNVQWQNRGHFFGVAAQAMRRILVDHARARHRNKRGGPNANRIPLEEHHAVDEGPQVDVLALDSALNSLAEIDPRQARVVELRYFAGLSVEDTAEVLGLSPPPSNVSGRWRRRGCWIASLEKGRGRGWIVGAPQRPSTETD